MPKESDPFQAGLPQKQGLYDPAYEHDACGTGFVVNIKGVPSHAIVEQALTILDNLAHRGATVTGAGLLIQMPHNFLVRECAALGFDLPGPRYYGVGMLFLPTDETLRREFEQRLEGIINEEGQRVLGWRTVVTDTSVPGPTARAAQPVVRQVFIERSPAPSPVFDSLPVAPRWARLSRMVSACSTIAWEGTPLIFTTKPVPQASCSYAGSYRPCFGGSPAWKGSLSFGMMFFSFGNQIQIITGRR